LGVTPAAVCLSWAIQREGGSGGFVVMSTRSQYLRDNLACAVNPCLSEEHLQRIDALDANNRLIWGQVFLWPEADNDWRVLWSDTQVFETRAAYDTFKQAWTEFARVRETTTYRPT
jgi:hypothetical protein